MRHIFLTHRFFYYFSLVILCFLLSFSFPAFFRWAQLLLYLGLLFTAIDLFLLFRPSIYFSVKRNTPNVLSLGDEATIEVDVLYHGPFRLWIQLIDELPQELQIRDFLYQFDLLPKGKKSVVYSLYPKRRGELTFGQVLLYIESPLHFISRRMTYLEPQVLAVYPSIIQMKQLAFHALDRSYQGGGIKKIRQLGHSYEFDHIKNYVQGDDFRSINWKASSRRGQLMVNKYEEERAQQVYCIIDKSRSMLMPFEGLSLMDYAINTSLALSNIVLRKHDKAGLLSFSDAIGGIIKADGKPQQLRKILHALYKEQEREKEANFELLYAAVRKFIKVRSLLLLFTNFESEYALDRVLPILRRLNRQHLLVVVFFVNTEIEAFVKEDAASIEDVYHKTVARQFLYEKQQIAQRLARFGIQTILTRPEELSANTINRYLSLKAKGAI